MTDYFLLFMMKEVVDDSTSWGIHPPNWALIATQFNPVYDYATSWGLLQHKHSLIFELSLEADHFSNLTIIG